MHVRSALCMSASQPGSQAFSGACQQSLSIHHVDLLTCQSSTGDAAVVGLKGLLTDITHAYLLAR